MKLLCDHHIMEFVLTFMPFSRKMKMKMSVDNTPLTRKNLLTSNTYFLLNKFEHV